MKSLHIFAATAIDSGGLSVSSNFSLRVADGNDTPTVS